MSLLFCPTCRKAVSYMTIRSQVPVDKCRHVGVHVMMCTGCLSFICIQFGKEATWDAMATILACAKKGT